MALAVCLLFDPLTDRAIRQLWQRLEAHDGVSTLASHTHGRHLPHLSYAVLREYDVEAVRAAVAGLPDHGPLQLHVDAIGLFRRGRACLVPAVSGQLVARQEAVVEAVLSTGADLHRHYAPGAWVPHISIATRVRQGALGPLTGAVHDILPLEASADHAALVDSGTGERWPLPGVP